MTVEIASGWCRSKDVATAMPMENPNRLTDECCLLTGSNHAHKSAMAFLTASNE